MILDEIFGRANRTYQVTFKQSAPKGHKTINPGLVTISNYMVIYAKCKSDWSPNRAFAPRPRDKRYSSYIENFEADMQQWRLTTVNKAFCDEQGFEKLADAKKALGSEFEPEVERFVLDNAERVVQPVRPDYSQVGKETQDLIDESTANPDTIYRQDRGNLLPIILKDGKRWLFYSSKLRLIDGKYVTGEALSNVWDDLLSNNIHNEGGVKFPKGKKPEALLKRVFDLFSNPGELVMDSFLGSGTTAAAAHKMSRRWIGVEMGGQATTHCVPRLKSVVEGEQGGISKGLNWKGGGGFAFFRLGGEVFAPDGTISPGIKFAPLAAHIWFAETGSPIAGEATTPFLGTHDGTGIALLYNGILGDKSVASGNVLTRTTLGIIRESAGEFDGPLVVYGEATRMGPEALKREGITFKQTPYDVKAR